MSRRIETILILLAGVLMILVIVGLFTFDFSTGSALPIWLWMLWIGLALVLSTLLVLRDRRSPPTPLYVGASFVTALIFLFVYIQLRIADELKAFLLPVVAYLFLVVAYRVVRLIMRRTAR
jgi:hypothetical protein